MASISHTLNYDITLRNLLNKQALALAKVTKSEERKEEIQIESANERRLR